MRVQREITPPIRNAKLKTVKREKFRRESKAKKIKKAKKRKVCPLLP